MSAVISSCGLFRYRLDRAVQDDGPVVAFFGVNGSTADANEEDQTTRKWIGFSRRNGFSRYIVGNPFAYRARDVGQLALVADPVGSENLLYLLEIIDEADILIPCWGHRAKVPQRLWPHIDKLRELILAAGKPMMMFGITSSGDPKHPLMLGYDTPLVPFP